MYSPELNSLLNRELFMEKRFLDKVEDNAAVRIWSEKTQQEKDDETKQLFYPDYGDLHYLLDVKVDKHFFQAFTQYWNPAYSCFTFGKQMHPLENFVDLILAYPDTKKRVNIFALSIYGLVIFLKALGHINDAISDLFDWLDKRVTLVLAILAETFRYLSACRRAGEGRFIECALLLLAWFHSHFWKSLQDEDVELRAPWMIPVEILYRCGDFD
ncbi:hypothetical protein Goklo_008341 [Gossypium klotzschianum]|uniref:DUF7745 domain-containing protein n=1 Tax=Gossypium klotzschianum TaxID=34286 RepID=A0A7J8UZL8_9ROSI|nr:hypothetical protein [Gossypium klotzschianum]